MKKINTNIRNFILRLPDTSKWIFWILISIVLKSSFFVYRISETNYVNNIYLETYAYDGGDARSYIDPIENLIQKGEYDDDYRMPGYGWIYFLLRSLFSQGQALNFVIVLQLILSSISVYVLARIALIVLKSKFYFYCTFFLYVISTFVSIMDTALLTESFCTSALIFSAYYLLDRPAKNINLLWSGLFLTWAIFLKPVMVPLLALFLLYIVVENLSLLSSKNTLFRSLFIFILPFLLFEGCWVLRNFNKHNRFIPLTKSIYYPSYEKSYYLNLFEFIHSFGGSIVYWSPGSDITFFIPPPSQIKRKVEVNLPEYIYTSQFNLDSLVLVRNRIHEIDNINTTNGKRDSLLSLVRCQLDNYSYSIKKEKPILFYFSSRFNVLKTFFLHSGTYNLFSKASFDLNRIEFTVKIFYSLLYLFVVFFGFIGVLILLFCYSYELNFLFLSFLGLYLSLVFPLILKLDEFRYFIPAYPFFLLASFVSLNKVYKIVIQKCCNYD